jgi:signal transduction histidine kinase
MAAPMLMSHLAAELSHDLAVPLTSIIASLELLEERLEEHPDPEAAALLAGAQQAADRMSRMLGQHMGIDQELADRAHSDVDLGSVAFELAVDSAHLLRSADATIDIGCLPVVRADPDEMYSVLQNLLTNAVKFARPDVRPWVAISATRVPGAWRISVTDNGVGIPADRRADVFSLFSRARSRVEGHGIGLGTVARTIGANGGRVGAEPVAGGGAEVWFEIPASPDAMRPHLAGTHERRETTDQEEAPTCT